MGVTPLNLSLDFRSSTPIYLQIMEQVQHKVAAGELKPGDQLPTVRHLATELRINFNTVARAYRLLDEAGLISTQHGRGTYIWQSLSPEVARQMRMQTLSERVAGLLHEAARLGYTKSEVAAAMVQGLQAWQEPESENKAA